MMETINFTQSYLDMQGVEILGQKKNEHATAENKPVAPIIVAKEY